MESKYGDISKIVETQNPKQAQLYLDLGWKMFDKASVSTGDSRAGGGYILYSLAWYGENPKFPSNEDLNKENTIYESL